MNYFKLDNSNSFTFASNLALSSWNGVPFIIFNDDIFIIVVKCSIDTDSKVLSINQSTNTNQAFIIYKIQCVSLKMRQSNTTVFWPSRDLWSICEGKKNKYYRIRSLGQGIVWGDQLTDTSEPQNVTFTCGFFSLNFILDSYQVLNFYYWNYDFWTLTYKMTHLS